MYQNWLPMEFDAYGALLLCSFQQFQTGLKTDFRNHSISRLALDTQLGIIPYQTLTDVSFQIKAKSVAAVWHIKHNEES